jgi:nicotinamidase-related amidase
MNRLTTAVVTIDMHRGHLDPTVATMPLPAEAAARVTAANKVLIDGARRVGVPVIHVVTSYRDVSEIASNPWWKRIAGTDATRSNVLAHQLPGSPGLEVMPGLLDPADVVVFNKKRYDAFAATDLDFILRARGITTLLLTGVNTNSCVLATTVSANAKDYAPVVVEDCVDTMDRSLHEVSLNLIRQAFGWTATAREVLGAL